MFKALDFKYRNNVAIEKHFGYVRGFFMQKKKNVFSGNAIYYVFFLGGGG